MGTQLFELLGRGLKLSQAGAEFRVYASRAFKEIEAGHMALADLSGLQSGKLTVGAFPTFLNTVVPATVAVFSRAHPKVTIEVRDLRVRQIEEQLLHGELELGIAFHPTEHAELENEPLFDERMLLVVGPAHPLAGRSTLAMKELAGVPLAMLPRSFTTRHLIDDSWRSADGAGGNRVSGALLGGGREGDLASIVPRRRQHPRQPSQRLILSNPTPFKSHTHGRQEGLVSCRSRETHAAFKRSQGSLGTSPHGPGINK
ncbi:LysR substrate-binding domain-containing protein [Pseudomonas lini]